MRDRAGFRSQSFTVKADQRYGMRRLVSHCTQFWGFVFWWLFFLLIALVGSYRPNVCLYSRVHNLHNSSTPWSLVSFKLPTWCVLQLSVRWTKKHSGIPMYILPILKQKNRYTSKTRKYIPFCPVITHKLQYLEQVLKVIALTFICLRNGIGAYQKTLRIW